MTCCLRNRMIALLSLSAALPTCLLAQTPPPAEVTTAVTDAAATKRIFTLADFAQFAPKTAMDMIDQLPSFNVHTAADNERGLGQASENVLINGQRVTDKSGGAVDRLRNVPAGDVLRIELQEAAALGIAGLSGEVANVVLKEDRKASGRFEWSPRVRPDYAKPALLRGKVSYAGTEGLLDYTVSVQNYGNRGAIGGDDYLILSPTGSLIERRDQKTQFNYDNARFVTLLKYGGNGAVQANLNLTYNPYWQRNLNSQRRERTDDKDNDWVTRGRTSGFTYSASGDIAFPLLSGKLKLIGLQRGEHAPAMTTQLTDYDGNLYTDEGSRFGRDSRTSETIGRVEYQWKGGANDWQFSLERAYNSLDQRGTRGVLQGDGSFLDAPFPPGTGKVAEKRYEAVLSLSRPLAGNLDLQLVGGGEISRLRHVSRGEPARKFFRPKGSISLAWRPAQGWDGSVKLERKVGQINFFDFLAQPDLALGRENGANLDLVPPQSWQLSGEIGRNFNAWGKTRLRVYGHRIDDIVDFIPIGTNEQAVGNLPRATRLGAEWVSTIQFDPLGWKGAKVDITLGMERSRVRDPLTGAKRPISNTRDHWGSVNLRHDIPNSQIAWGAYFNFDHYGSAYYLNEITRNWEGPYFGAFVEHKNLAGFKVTAEAFNLSDARNHFTRTVYSGRRNVAPVTVRELQNQRVSQIFTLTVTGTF